jgi:glyoxylase-like metal-dependent hydrolase (beta-lactamase superfamily II)
MAIYSWTLLRAGTFKLDAGSMFGLIPRSVWSRTITPDEKNRLTVQHNCLLLKGGGKTYLLETGSGDKMDTKSKAIFDLQDRSILDALKEAGTDPASIDGVTVSHLHFDHAGGLTRLAREGETPDWVGKGTAESHGVKLSFPNAKVVAQAREWADALANRSVMTRTYFKDHLEPFALDAFKKLVVPVDSPRPFVRGYTPDRQELPRLALESRLTEVFPGVHVFLVPGHTWGQQATLFEDDKGRTVVFVPDVLPTAAHVGQAYSLGYDVEPYTSMVTRHWLLSEAADRDWLLVLDHEPGNPIRRVRRNAAGWFDLVEDSN